MGTNYYAGINKCEGCGKFEEKIHLGKSSFGWRFGVEIQEEYYKDFYEFEKFITQPEIIIMDEYGEVISATDLLILIESKETHKPHSDMDSKQDSYVDLIKGAFS